MVSTGRTKPESEARIETKQKRSPAMAAVAAPPPLTADQIAFFKREGYLILRGVLPEAKCAALRDRVWAECAPHAIRRDDPASHVGPWPAWAESESTLHYRKGFSWRIRTLGGDPDVLALTCSEPTLFAAAEQLIGTGRVARPVVGGDVMGIDGSAWPGGPVDPAGSEQHRNDGIRGVYITRRGQKDSGYASGLHTDGHPFMLGVVSLLDDVDEGGGAFKVWPRSHLRLYDKMLAPYDQPRLPQYAHLADASDTFGVCHTPAYLEELKQIDRDTQPVECHGKVGDVVIWHHRLGHAAGLNTTGKRMRWAVLHDYSPVDLGALRGGLPPKDPWRDWSEEVKRTSASGASEGAARSRL